MLCALPCARLADVCWNGPRHFLVTIRSSNAQGTRPQCFSARTLPEKQTMNSWPSAESAVLRRVSEPKLAKTDNPQRLKAFYINTDLDSARREGLEITCLQLELDCERVVPPKLSSPAVQRCVEQTPLRSFECSLVHAHKKILERISRSSSRALVLEDDARLNGQLATEEAKEFLAATSGDFIMAGWCDPSCAHAYLVSPIGASMLLDRGFARPKLPADAMFPAFEVQDVLFPEKCPGGYPGDLGLFCQDRSTPHCKSYSYY